MWAKTKKLNQPPESSVNRGGTISALLVFGVSLVPLALVMIKKNRAALEEWVRGFVEMMLKVKRFAAAGVR
jgi:hypothetical protein